MSNKIINMTDAVNQKKKWIFIAAFLDLFAISLVLPSMSAHFKSLGASYFIIGAMNSIYASAQLLSGPVIGSWSDKIGRQKIFIISYLIVACCYPVLGILNSLYIILLLRAVTGTFKLGQTLVQTIVSDQFPVEEQTLLFGQLKLVAAVSFAVGPIFGGHLAEFEDGFSYTCCCTGALLALNSVIGYLHFADVPVDETNPTLKGKSKKKLKTDSTGIIEAIRSLGDINWFAYGKIFALKFILDMSAGAFHSNYNIKVQERFDISPKYTGYTIAFPNFVGVISALLIGVSFSNNLSGFIFWAIILRISHMVLRIILTDMLMRKCPSWQTGSIAGVSNSVSNLARLVTPLTVGIVEDSWGTNSGNLLAALAAAIGIFISLKIEQTHPKNS